MAKLVLLLFFVCFQFSRPEELPAIEQVKLDLDDEIPFNNQTAPDTEVLDGADEDQWNPGPKFNYDWLNEKLPDNEAALNNTSSNALSVLEKLIALAEMIAEYSDEENSSEWDDDLSDDGDDDYSYWDILKDWSYTAQFKELLKNKNGKEYEYSSIISLLKPKNSKGDKVAHNLSNGKIQPVKRFTSV